MFPNPTCNSFTPLGFRWVAVPTSVVERQRRRQTSFRWKHTIRAVLRQSVPAAPGLQEQAIESGMRLATDPRRSQSNMCSLVGTRSSDDFILSGSQLLV